MDEPTWISQRLIYQDALQYMKGRKEGTIRSFQTPWEKLNDAGINGIEWHSTVLIGARPGTGKTMIKDQIVREAFELNAGEDMRILDMQFEMFGRVTAIRDFSSAIGKSYKYLCSADKKAGPLDNEILLKCFEYAKKKVKYPIDIIQKAMTVDDMKKTVIKYMEANATEVKEGEVTKKIYKKTLIAIDHSNLFKSEDGDKTKMLYKLGEITTELKRIYPIIWIILSQLKREVESPERNENGKYGNYILDTDFLGGDALFQHADMVIGINRPAMKFIKLYGPDRYIIENDRVLVWHFLKCRNGDVRISFFESKPEEMKVVEMQTPPTSKKIKL